MTNPPLPQPTWKTQLQLALAVGTAFIAMILIASGWQILTRPLWMDEIHTWLIVTDPSLSHAMTALSNGADFNPPTYYLTLRAFGLIFGTSYAAMRVFSLLAIAVSLGLMAAMLRRRFSTAVSVAATSAIAMQPLIIQQATEGRFYAFWFLLVVAFCFVRSSQWNERRRTLLSSVLAILICTVHYFGVLSLGLLFLVDLRNQKDAISNKVQWLRFGIPYAAGVISLIGCMGFYIGQKSTLTIATWISSPTLSRTYEFFLEFFPVIPLALAAIGWLMSQADATSKHEPTDPQPRQFCLSLSGFGMPLALLILTFVLQPVLVSRYAIVCFIAWPVVIATLMKRVKPGFSIAFIIVCTLLGADTSGDLVERYQQLNDEAARIASRLQAVEEPVIFEDRIEHYPAVLEHPDAQWFLLDFDNPTIEKAKLRTVQRDVGRAVERFYPQFDIRSMNQLVRDGQQSFVVVPYRKDLANRESQADQHRLQTEYPDFDIQRIARRVFRFRFRGLPATVAN